MSNLLQLLTFAAVVSFMTSPILALINYQVMSGLNVPEACGPGPVLTAISWTGFGFFALMALGYAVSLFKTA